LKSVYHITTEGDRIFHYPSLGSEIPEVWAGALKPLEKDG